MKRRYKTNYSGLFLFLLILCVVCFAACRANELNSASDDGTNNVSVVGVDSNNSDNILMVNEPIEPKKRTVKIKKEYKGKEVNENDLKTYTEYDQKGNVVKKQWHAWGDDLLEITQYNNSGDILKNERFNGEGVLTDEQTYTYNKLDQLVEYVYYHYDENKNESVLKAKKEYVYDRKGNKKKERIFENNKYYYNEYQYDTAGNMTSKVRTNENDVIDNRMEYEYDSKGNLIAKKQTDSQGIELKSWEYEYSDDMDTEYVYLNGTLDEINETYYNDRKEKVLYVTCVRLSTDNTDYYKQLTIYDANGSVGGIGDVLRFTYNLSDDGYICDCLSDIGQAYFEYNSEGLITKEESYSNDEFGHSFSHNSVFTYEYWD